ncbi:MAG: MarR family transcriptional regulator [Saprospiraceae bacterium]|nr:MarR family transcriptional regulator [Candidatus Parvibacillus calidus]
MEILDDVIFYHIEKAIKSYRQFAQSRIRLAGYTMTIDQWLILKVLIDEPDIQLNELAVKVFKDSASVTRIIILLEKGKFIKKSVHQSDKRRILLKVTAKGQKAMEDVSCIVLANRRHALNGITKDSIDATIATLKIISGNCIAKIKFSTNVIGRMQKT